MTVTFADALGKHNITLPDPDLSELEVPVLTGAQAQGDVGIFPRAPFGKAELAGFTKVPAAGIQVVRGENGGNTHILDAYHGDVYYKALPDEHRSVALGLLHVTDGAVAYLTHTDEHGSNGIGPGDYIVNGKQEQRDLVMRVAD